MHLSTREGPGFFSVLEPGFLYQLPISTSWDTWRDPKACPTTLPTPLSLQGHNLFDFVAYSEEVVFFLSGSAWPIAAFFPLRVPVRQRCKQGYCGYWFFLKEFSTVMARWLRRQKH